MKTKDNKYTLLMTFIFIFTIVSLISTLPKLIQIARIKSDAEKRIILLQEAQAYFNKVAIFSGGQIESIDCYKNRCDSIAYFNFNNIPDDLELFIKDNTATFSQLKKDYLGESDVTIFAGDDSGVVLYCNGQNGAVVNCEKYSN